MLMGIEGGEPVDTQHGRQKQGLKAAPQRLHAVMQQGEIVTRMRVFIGFNGLLELGHHEANLIVLVEPRGKQMHAHKRQTRRDADNLCARATRPMAGCPTRASLAPIELPLRPPPVEMADTHRKRCLPLRDLVEERSAWTRWIF